MTTPELVGVTWLAVRKTEAEHTPGWRVDHDGTRTFRGGCPCTPCALRRVPSALADLAFAARHAVAVLLARRS